MDGVTAIAQILRREGVDLVLWYFPEYKIAVISTSYADRSVS
jgi:hypothetical protein